MPKALIFQGLRLYHFKYKQRKAVEKMKLKFDVKHTSHPDPFLFKDGDTYYLYPSDGWGEDGVPVYTTKYPFGEWHYVGIAAKFEGAKEYWAPSVIKYKDKYYMYLSFARGGNYQFMHVAEAESPLGPFKNEKMLYQEFSIDSHVVETEAGLFLFYAKNKYKPDYEGERIGTRIFVDRLIDPYTPAYNPVEKVVPDFDEERFTPDYSEKNRWHTIEGAFWFKEGEYQYLTYSGGCYQDDTYHVGYAVAKSDEADLTKVEFKKVTKDGRFNPLLIKNSFEEGTGHHSMLKIDGEYYAFYHGRDIGELPEGEYQEMRTARVCKVKVSDGILTAEMKENEI